MKETIKEWYGSMKIMVKERPYFRELKTRDVVALILEHLQEFHTKYQDVSPSCSKDLFLLCLE